MNDRCSFIPDGMIETYTGRFVNPMDLDPEAVDLEDIAQALSLRMRFSGHTLRPYSVARHCCDMLICVLNENRHDGLDERTRLAILLHDAAEAYLPDIPRPIKDSFWISSADSIDAEPFRAVEARVLERICKGLGVRDLPFDRVAEWDLRMLATEAFLLMRSAGEAWPSIHGVRYFEHGISMPAAYNDRDRWLDMTMTALAMVRELGRSAHGENTRTDEQSVAPEHSTSGGA